MVVRLASTLEETDSELLNELAAHFGMKRAEYIRWAVLFAIREHSGKDIKIPANFVAEMRSYMGKVWEQVETRAQSEPEIFEEPEPEPEPEPRFPADLWKSLTVAPMEASRENAPPPFPEPRGPPAEYLPLDEYQPSSAYIADMILYIRTYFTSLTEEEQEHLWKHMQLYIENPYHREVIDKFITYVAGMIYYRMYYEFPHFCPSCEAIGRKTSWTEWYANDHFTYEPRPDGKYDCGPCVVRGGRWDR